MKKILFICAHRIDRSPSQRFRFEQYLDVLEQNGFYAKISYLISDRVDKAFYSNSNYTIKFLVLVKSTIIRIHDLFRARHFDYIFIQREAFMLGTSFFEKLFSLYPAKLIFDFDDSIWLPDVDGGNKNLTWLKKPAKTKQIIRYADLIVAGNRYLADYAVNFNKNVVEVPTTIDTDLYFPKPKKNNGIVCIGWSGSFSTIKHFELVLPVLIQLKSLYNQKVNFKLIGDSDYCHDLIEIDSQNWKFDTEVSDLQKIDIGLMPLPDDQWSEGKCGLKGLQYMALEIPTIMSPVGVNTEIIQEGVNGFLASTEEEWFDKISRLIESPELRKELGQRGRQTVIDRYSKQSQEQNFLNLFN